MSYMGRNYVLLMSFSGKRQNSSMSQGGPQASGRKTEGLELPVGLDVVGRETHCDTHRNAFLITDVTKSMPEPPFKKPHTLNHVSFLGSTATVTLQ